MSALTVFKGTQNIWIGEEVQCDSQFVAALQRIDDYAGKSKVQIYVTKSYRPPDQPVRGPKYTPAKRSNHHAGHAIDMNIKYKGKLYGWNDLMPSNLKNLPQPVQAFIDKIRHDPGLKWGGDFKKFGRPDPDPIHIDDRLNVKNPTVWQEKVNALQMANPLIPKREPLKNVAKVAKHGWKFKIAATLLTIIMVTNTVYYLGVFEMDPVLQPAQQIMDQIWSAPVLAQVHQFISQIFSGDLWSGLKPAPTLETLTGTWSGTVKIWLEHSPSVNYSYDAQFTLEQSGNAITGTLTMSTKTFQITDGRLEMNKIQFKADNLIWSGTYTTNTMVGTEEQDTSIPLPSGMEYGDIWVGTFNLHRGY